MLRDTIDGLERIFKTDIDRPKVILITGPPGSMKTSFIYALISKYVKKSGEFALYNTLEESVSSHLKNMESLGVELSLNMQVSDFTDLREVDMAVGEEGETNYVEFVERMVTHFKKTRGDKFTVFALDSLGALYSLMPNKEDMRSKMFYFFKMLRDNALYSFIIMEREPGMDTNLLGNEGFLADGIIHLGLDRSRGKLTRFLQVEKMRACQHSMEKHAIEIGKSGFMVLGPIFEV